MTSPAPLLLIDGDQFLFKSTVAVEHEVRWDDENHVLFSNSVEAFDTFERMLKNEVERIEHLLFETIPHENLWIAFTQGEPFRMKVYPGYKGNRKGSRKPLCYWETKEAVEAKYKTFSVDGLEADDIMGIWATKPAKDPEQLRIIVSDDKDMQTIPGYLWRQGELHVITGVDAYLYWARQTLTGDTTDGYPGCPGIGPKTAEKVLRGLAAMPYGWDQLIKPFLDAGLTEDDALAQARCARILHHSDFDMKTRTPILWSPYG